MNKLLALLGIITLFSSSSTTTVLNTSVGISNNINDQEFDHENYFINSTAQEIKKFKNKNQSFNFIKKIKDIFNNELYFIQYEESSAIVSISNYETLDISNIVYDQEKFNKEIIYIPTVGLTYKNNNKLYTMNNNVIIADEMLNSILLVKNNYNYFLENNKNANKSMRNNYFEEYNKARKIRHKRAEANDALLDSISTNNIRVSHEVPHAWWFRQLDSEEELGYTTSGTGRKKQGLCEYIALSMMILYQELFVSGGYLDNDEINEYFTVPDNSSTNVNNGLMEHKYYQSNEPQNSFIRKLWRLNDWAVDIKSGGTISTALNNFLTNKPISGKYEENWSASSWHSSSPEDLLLSKKVPIMLSYVFSTSLFNMGGHNIVIYGYDQPTGKFLVNFGWDGGEYAQRLLSKSSVWGFFSWGYWYTFHHKDNESKLPLKKLFSYNSNKYTSKELQTMGVI